MQQHGRRDGQHACGRHLMLLMHSRDHATMCQDHHSERVAAQNCHLKQVAAMQVSNGAGATTQLQQRGAAMQVAPLGARATIHPTKQPMSSPGVDWQTGSSGTPWGPGAALPSSSGSCHAALGRQRPAPGSAQRKQSVNLRTLEVSPGTGGRATQQRGGCASGVCTALRSQQVLGDAEQGYAASLRQAAPRLAVP